MKQRSFHFKWLLNLVSFLFVYDITFAQTWTNVHPDVNGTGDPHGSGERYRGRTLVLGDSVYLGGGDDANAYEQFLTTWNPVSNTWTPQAPCPAGMGGDVPIGFTIGSRIFFGTGFNSGFKNGFFEYLPGSNTWATRSTFSSARAFGVSFSIGNYGYAGTGEPGNGNAANDFYQYDPVLDSWTTLAVVPGPPRWGGVGFSIGNKGYIGLGLVANQSSTLNDMYEFDPTGSAGAGSWTAMNPMPTAGVREPAYFVLCNKLILTMGDTLGADNISSRETWMFDPNSGVSGGTWTRLPNFPGQAFYSAQGFAIGGVGYVVGGDSVGTVYTSRQMWKFTPPGVSTISTASGNVTICSGSTVNLSASGGINYLWSTGATTSSITVNPITATTYSVATGTCVIKDSSIIITVLPGPTVSISGNTAICYGTTTRLSASGGASYSWTPTAGLSSPVISDPTASPTITTTYTVTASNGTCSGSGSSKITVNANPSIYAGANVTINIGENYTITTLPDSSGLSYSWMPQVVSSTGSAAVVKPLSTTKYYVTATNVNGCSATDSIIVYVNLNCGTIFIPDAFSPNGDGENDVFFLMAQSSECIQSMIFDIYDRWGNKIFEATNLSSGWEGKYKGKEMDASVFVYSLQATLINGTSVSKKGNISLVK